MTCSEIENRLPAFLEKIISPEEGKSVEAPLASRNTSRAVLALHCCQVGEPERKGVAPLPIPLAEPGTVETPSAETPAGRPPEGDLPAKHRQRSAAPPPEKEGKADRIAESQAPRGGGRP